MLESIYAADKERTAELPTMGVRTRLPKNIRQVGDCGGRLGIYLEDYVKTYTKQMAEADYTQCCVAVLVGGYCGIDNAKTLFIYGAVAAEAACEETRIVFSETVWSQVYEAIAKYFPNGEAVGWYIGGPGFLLQDEERLLRAHLDNFSDRNRVLLTYDVMEREEAFWLPEGSRLVKQEGYYLYYEKNEEMQNYMLEHKLAWRDKTELVDDSAVEKVRSRLSGAESRGGAAKGRGSDTEGRGGTAKRRGLDKESRGGTAKGRRADAGEPRSPEEDMLLGLPATGTDGQRPRRRANGGLVYAAALLVIAVLFLGGMQLSGEWNGFSELKNGIKQFAAGLFQKDADDDAEQTGGDDETLAFGELSTEGQTVPTLSVEVIAGAVAAQTPGDESSGGDTSKTDGSGGGNTSKADGSGGGDTSKADGSGGGDTSKADGSGGGNAAKTDESSGGNTSKTDGSSETETGKEDGTDTKEEDDTGTKNNDTDTGSVNAESKDDDTAEPEKEDGGEAETTIPTMVNGIDITKLRYYMVQAGDTLAGICTKEYGTVEHMELIKELNQIEDENKIYIGQELVIP